MIIFKKITSRALYDCKIRVVFQKLKAGDRLRWGGSLFWRRLVKIIFSTGRIHT